MAASGANHGMPMSLALFRHAGHLTLISAFENGLATVARLQTRPGETDTWITTYRSQAHSQPILSLDLAPELGHFFTSGADAIIAKHPIPSPHDASACGGGEENQVEEIARIQDVGMDLAKVTNTKHAGQQSLCVRSDGRIFATAGWDSAVRVYSAKTLKELAVLKWQQAGCYAVCFAAVPNPVDTSSAEPESCQENGSNEGLEEHSRTVDDSLAVAQPAQAQSSTSPTSVSVRDRRINAAKMAHWIAAGNKEGKIGLWTIY